MIEQYQKTVQETVIEIKNSEIYSIKKNEIVRRAVRLFHKDKIAIVASKGNVGFSSLIKEVDNNIRYGQNYDYPLPTNAIKHDSFIRQKQIFTEKEFIRFGEKLMECLRKKFPDFIFMNKIRFALVEKKIAFVNMTDLSVNYPLVDITLLFKRKNSKNIFDGVFPYLSSNMFSPEEYIEEMEKIVRAVDNPIKLRNYNIPVAFPSFDQTIIAGKIKESIIGDNYQKGTSLFNNLLGKKVFNEKLTIHDISYLPEKNLFYAFDDESFIRKEPALEIVGNGILNNLIYDRRTAAMYEKTPTGNGLKPDYNKFPQTMANSFIFSDDEKIETPGKAIIPVIMGGGSVDDGGNFAIPVQFSLLMENGEIKAMLPQLLLSGNIFKMLGENYMGTDNKYFSKMSLNPYLYTRVNVKRIY
ncbi:hypothetical protein J7J58_06245 [candidate division WOR-3 bacterium]|nr:hypothetical protein [candidate division WOR-3 bacterium]